MDTRLLESSEFYRRRYENFSTLVVIPVFIAMLALLVFSLIGTREVTIKTVGQIAPAATVTRIQSTSGERIITNNLEESRTVQAGDILLAYDNGTNDTQLTSLRQQLDTVSRQQQALEQLINGLQDDGVDIGESDEFGYASMLADFRAQVTGLRQDATQQRQATEGQNAAVVSTQAAVDEQIAATQATIDDYAELRQAVSEGNTLPADNTFSSTYALYQQQVSAGETDQASEVTAKMLADIDSSTQELRASISTLRTQRSSAGSVTPQSTSIASQIEALRAQYQLNANKERTSLAATKLELQTNIKLAQNASDKSTVTAPVGGVLHVNEEIKGMSEIPAGTTVAELYPALTDKTALDVVLAVPVSDIPQVRQGQTVRLSNYHSSAKPLIVTATVHSVASSPTRTEQGNYYEVRARVATRKGQAEQLRYGFQGETVIITGKKTFFNYYKDQLLHP